MTTTMSYDVLNRVTSKSYNDGPPATPVVTYCYDGNISNACAGVPTPPYASGRLTMVGPVSVDEYTNFSEFDITGSQQIINGTTHSRFAHNRRWSAK